MGTLVTVDSRSFLLQREDFPATLAALRAYIQENPDDVHDPDAVLAADNLPAALDAGDWFNTLDEYGDIVKL